nr:SCO2322 family protein [Streptomyces sp. TP-A0874]
MALVVSSAVPAHAEGYRYWSFWEWADGGWSYATEGPATTRPADGAVQGYRFSVSEDSQAGAKPRGAADFDAVCADTPAEEGSKRVAVVLDFGTAADAPAGERPPQPRTACARVSEDASGGEALAAVAKPLRYNSAALLCGIAGYPAKGCGEPVSGDSGRTSEDTGAADGHLADDGGSGPSFGLYTGLIAVLALGAAGLWQARRR